MSRCDSAAIVPNTSELLPEPETPVNTVSRRLGISTLTSLRLFTRAPWTRIRSWLSAVVITVTLVRRPRARRRAGRGGTRTLTADRRVQARDGRAADARALDLGYGPADR